MSEPDQSASEVAKTLSSLGNSKGGKARANVLSPEERSEIARNAVRARWARLGKLKPEPVTTEIVPTVLAPGEGFDDEENETETTSLFSMFEGVLEIDFRFFHMPY